MHIFNERMTIYHKKRIVYIIIVLLLIFLHSPYYPTVALSSVRRGPIPGIDSSTPYCFFYGKWNDCIISEVIKKFKLVILHPGISEVYITPAQVALLRENGVIVIGYIPFGEDYVKRAGDGTGPVYYDQNCVLIYEHKDFASWLVDEVTTNGDPSHDGIPDKNPNFGSYYVNAGDPKWQDFLKTATIEHDGFAGTEYILNYLGCDGLFIDVIETASPWLPYSYSWRGMFDLLDTISNLYPDKYMVVNRPLFACSLESYSMKACDKDSNSCTYPQFCFCDFTSQYEARDAFRQNINAFVWESYSLDKAYDDFSSIKAHIRACSDNSDDSGFNVLVLDYYNLIHHLYPCMDYHPKEIIEELGWLDYIAPGPLYQIGNWVYNFSNNLSYPLIDGYFGEFAPWNISSIRSDPSKDIQKESADIIAMFITHDSEYLYIKIQCRGKIPKDFASNFYQIYLGSDLPSPGYKGAQSDWKGEFNYLYENEKLFRYTGVGSDWSWEQINAICSLSSYAHGIEDETSIELAIPRCTIGEEEVEGKATKILFNIDAFDLGRNDYAPDNPREDYYLYEYEPRIQIDGFFDDWKTDCGNIFNCGNNAPSKTIFATYPDASGDVEPCDLDMVNAWNCNDLSNIYFRIQFACALPQPLWGGNFYPFFIDVDQNHTTGFSACKWRIGAEYLWENGKLYKYNGTGCDWSWEWVTDTPYSIGLSDSSQIEISIPRKNITTPQCGRNLSEDKPLRFIFGGYRDVVPNSPENNFYSWPSKSYRGDCFCYFDPKVWTNAHLWGLEEHALSWTQLRKENVRILDDTLHITIAPIPEDKIKGEDIRVEGGEISSTCLYYYGNYRAKLKVPESRYVISSFFIFYHDPDKKNPEGIYPNHEIDIEILKAPDGEEFEFWFITRTCLDPNNYAYARNAKKYTQSELGFDPSQDYHVYGFNWQEDKVQFFIDGNNIWTSDTFIPHIPGNIMLNGWSHKTWNNVYTQLPQEDTYSIKWVKVNPVVSISSLSAIPGTGVAPLEVIFHAEGSGGSGDFIYEWDFDNDGTVDSTDQNPHHTYNDIGTFTARVTVTDANDPDNSATGELQIITVPSPTPYSPLGITKLTATPGSGIAPLDVSFGIIAKGGSGNYKYEWDCDNDGIVDSTDQDPHHTYNDIGTFTARVSVTDANDPDNSATGELQIITVPSPTSYSPLGITKLTATPGSGIAPLEIVCGVTVNGGSGKYAYKWDFDNDGVVDSTDQNPSYTYNDAGTFAIEVIIEDIEDSNNIAAGHLTITIVERPATINIDITASPIEGEAPLDVNFRATITGDSPPYTVEWNFGDGSTDISETNDSTVDVSHTYHNPGTYQVWAEVISDNAEGGKVQNVKALLGIAVNEPSNDDIECFILAL